VAGGPGGPPAERARATGDFLRHRLFEPCGMTSATPSFDGAGDFVGSSFVHATARDFARFGELYRHDGVTGLGAEERLLPVGWLDHARTQVATDPETGFGYGRHWWLWPQFPGSLACHGYEGQFTLVVPDGELVLVHLGKTARDDQRCSSRGWWGSPRRRSPVDARRAHRPLVASGREGTRRRAGRVPATAIDAPFRRTW
jgi:CubicO group peptidase (beta-lactamase class C family)